MTRKPLPLWFEGEEFTTHQKGREAEGGQEATAGGEGQTPTRGVGNPKEWIPPDFPPAEPRDPL